MLSLLLRPLRALALLLLGGGMVVAGAWILFALTGLAPGLSLSLQGLDLVADPASGPSGPWATAGVVVLLLGLLLALLSLWAPGGARPPASVILATPDSTALALPGTTVRMSSRSLHALVAWLAGRVDGVRDVVPQVRLGDSGWDVRCHVGLWATSSIPAVSDQLRTRLGADLLHHTGIAMDSLLLDFDYGARADRDDRVR